jgi:hypothetical protein
MNASLRALLTGLIDYAGLFPPTRLPLDTAVRNYVRYRTGAEAWMLGRFICPAARLAELAQLVVDGPPVSVSALGRGGATRDEFLAGLNADLRNIEAHRGRLVVDVLETKLTAIGTETIRNYLDPMIERIDGLRPPPALFVELPTGTSLDEAFHNLGEVNATREPSRPRVGFKLRCGGLDAAAFPGTAQVARGLRGCHPEVPFKATAGLHHPLPQRDHAIGATMHGFVNVFVAGVLMHVHDLTAEHVEPILRDATASHFVFTDDGVRWGEWYATTAEIRAARRDAVLSFGSCSFDEPRDDLRALGWL